VKTISTISSANSHITNNSRETKYSHILSDMISEATLRNISEDQSSLPSNPWKRPAIPTTIDFTGNYSTQFTPLKATNPPTSLPANDALSDTTTVTTIQSAISKALAEHREELEEMRATFQQEISHYVNIV
jgi:hypothetical protein